jgi:hypothetical protein
MEKPRSRPRFAAPAAVLAVVFAVFVAACLVPDAYYLTELNRNGKWPEADRLGRDMLAHRGTFSRAQIGEIYFNVIYANVRLDRKPEAVRLAADYDAFAAASDEPAAPWLGRELAKLKAELGLLSEAQLGLVQAMEANAAGDFRRARELAESVLAAPAAEPVQLAAAHFVAAAASVRLVDAAAAAAHLAAYDGLKSALPPGHPARADEPYLRQGLADLEAAVPAQNP